MSKITIKEEEVSFEEWLEGGKLPESLLRRYYERHLEGDDKAEELLWKLVKLTTSNILKGFGTVPTSVIDLDDCSELDDKQLIVDADAKVEEWYNSDQGSNWSRSPYYRKLK